MFGTGHNCNVCQYNDVRSWAWFMSFKEQQAIFVDTALQIIQYKSRL